MNFKLKITLVAIFLCAFLGVSAQRQANRNELRAPAFPLITIDPNTSAWSYSDNLYDDAVRHWTGKPFPLLGVLKVDGVAYRFMGKEDIELEAIAKMAEQAGWSAKFTMQEPSADWMNVDFSDEGWKRGEAPFGTKDKEPTAKTDWQEPKIWVRREFYLNEDLQGKPVYVEFTHDDDAIIYVNGIEVANTGQATGKNRRVKLPEAAVKTLKKGKNVLAGYCYNRVANGYFDFGLYTEKKNSVI